MAIRGMYDVAKVWCLLLIVRTARAQCPGIPPTCLNGGTCMIIAGSTEVQCNCPISWTGQRCDVPILGACVPDPCQNGGVCNPSQSSYNCTCGAGFTGMNCEIPILDACVPDPCQNGGMCTTSQSSYNCTCGAGFTGMNCETDACIPDPCKNGGMCVRQTTGNKYDCMCSSDFVGMNCENRSPCNPNPCMNGGMCTIQSQGMYNCACPAGVTGNNCQNNACDSSPCQNNGMCSPQSSGNMYNCACINGATGTNCQNNACDSSPCQNNGMCSPQSSGNMYNCACINGATGTNCQNQAAGGTSNTTVIVVVVVVVVVVLIVVAIAVVFFIKRSQRRRRLKSSRQELTGMGRENDYISNSRGDITGMFAADANSREFPRDKLHLFGQVGSGSFAVVYKAAAEGIVNGGTNTTVAVKMLKESASPNDQSDFKKELRLYSQLDPHPNVLSMLGCCTDKDPMYIILEYVPHGNLQIYLRHIRTGTEPAYQNKAEFKKDNLSPTEILTFASQVVRGMEYLASKQCIHRDLATRNILIGEGMVCKVADFGLARDVAEDNQYEMKSQGRVPVRWMAPESLISNMYTSKSDVWSFGVLLWELVTLGSHPYPGMSSQKVINELKKGYRLPKPDHCGEDIYKVMTDCWKEQPNDRPDFAQLHIRIDDLLGDATGYLKMGNLNQDDYMYLEPGEPSSVESN